MDKDTRERLRMDIYLSLRLCRSIKWPHRDASVNDHLCGQAAEKVMADLLSRWEMTPKPPAPNH